MKIYPLVLAILLNSVQHSEANDLGGDSRKNIEYVAPSGVKCLKCPRGTYLLSHCKTENTTSHCQLCEDGTFNSENNIADYCYPCEKYCENVELVPVVNCSHTSDLKCECPKGKYNLFPNFEKDQAKCVEFGPCQPGYGIRDKGPSVGNTTCIRCVQGRSFSSTTSAVDECQPCTKCDSRGILNECTLTQDRKCVFVPSDQHRGSANDDDSFPLLEVILSVACVLVIVIIVILMIILLKSKRCGCKEEQGEAEELQSCQSTNESTQLHPLENNDDQQTAEVPPVPLQNGTASLPSTPRPPSTTALQIPKMSENNWGSSLIPILQKVVDGLISSGSWEFFIRIFYQVSNNKINADTKIQEVKSNCPNAVKEQIYQCLAYICERGAKPEMLIEALTQRKCHSLVATLRQDFPDVFQPVQTR